MIFALGLLLAACGGGADETETDGDAGGDDEPDTEETDDDTDDEDGDDDDTAATGDPVEGGELIYGTDAEPNGLTPATVSDSASTDAHNLVHAMLYRQQSDAYEVEPEVAAGEPQVSEDGLEYVIEIRDDVYFSDGEQLTADDVAFTIGIYMMEDIQVLLSQRLSVLIRKQQMNLKHHLTSQIPHCLLVLVFILYLNIFLVKLTAMRQLKSTKLAQLTLLVGAGPYEMTDWTSGQYINYEARDDYHEEGPYIQQVTWRLGDNDAQLANLQANEIDVMNVPPQDLVTAESVDGFNISEVPGFGYNYIGWNHRNELFESPTVRRALTMAIDRQGIIDGIMSGHATIAEFPHSPEGPVYTDEIEEIPFDPDGALELFAEEGWELEGDQLVNDSGEQFSFNLLTNSEAHVRTDWIVAVQQMLGEIGIAVETETMEFGAYLDRIQPPNWDFDAVAGAWNLALDPNPEQLFHSDNIEAGQNNIAYASDEFDELAGDNRSIIDPDERIEVLQDAFLQVAEDQAYTFMYYATEFSAYRDNVQNFQHNPRVNLFRVNEWWIEE
ncbi:LOW QUALITY PROTEIN: oligopeptide ABC transporter, periplasmic oligopeptide-binding protein OppA [Geomicrobium sp. JCM 19037]|nr:LOW QUALITY PROTEIN: oligopeptide ABC transporter, periplasmic oligopeptide-binding protein OppA [Geomicrobium sp. JCM 19037]